MMTSPEVDLQLFPHPADLLLGICKGSLNHYTSVGYDDLGNSPLGLNLFQPGGNLLFTGDIDLPVEQISATTGPEFLQP